MKFERLFVKAAILCLTLSTFAEGACPQILFIERRGSSTISCVTEEKTIVEAFWYRGSISHTIPILRWENGHPGGTEYGKGQYVIDSKGAMTIHNASVKHEANYFFVAFFEDEEFEESNVTVVITVQPDPPCPKVTNCFNCEECHLIVSGNGTFTCSMIGVRPKMNISWITEGDPGMDITLHPLNVKSNPNGYTWDVSIGLSYRTFTCGQKFFLQCIAHDDQKLLKYSTPLLIETGRSYKITTDQTMKLSSSRYLVNVNLETSHSYRSLWMLDKKMWFLEISIRINQISSMYVDSGNCNEGSNSNKQLVFIPIFVAVTILIAITVFSALCFNARRKDQRPMQTTVDPEVQPLTSSKSTYLDTTAQRIADFLKKAYEPHCSVHVLPWVDPIPITSVSIDYEIAFENALGTTKNSSCHKILQDISLNDFHRAMIKADRGNGKTYFAKQIIHRWSQEKVNSFILIFIDAEDTCQNMDIISMILRMLPTSHGLTKEVIHQVLNSSEVLVLIDGLDDLSVGDGEKSLTADNEKQLKTDTESTDNISTFNARLTIKEILEDNLNEEDNNVHVWVTSRGLQNTRYDLKLPFVKINLPKFSEQQMNSYIKKTCSYYINFKGLKKRKPEGSEMSVNTRSEPLHDHSDLRECLYSEESTENTAHQKDKANSEEVYRMVQKNVKKHNVLRDFKNNILVFVLLVHIIAAKLTLTPEYLHDLNVENMASLIATTVKALLLSSYRKNTKLSEELIDRIEITLEKIAFQMTYSDETFPVSFSKDRDNHVRMAEAVGILHTNDQNNSIKVNFGHTSIEEYFAARFISKLDKVKYECVRKTIEKNHEGVWKLIFCLEGLK